MFMFPLKNLARKWLKSILTENKDLFIQNQYHDSCWPDYVLNQGISSHAVDLVFLEYTSLNARKIERIYLMKILTQ